MKQTTFSCDLCGTAVDSAKDLQRVIIQFTKETVGADEVCPACRAKLSGAVQSIVIHSSIPTDRKVAIQKDIKLSMADPSIEIKDSPIKKP